MRRARHAARLLGDAGHSPKRSPTQRRGSHRMPRATAAAYGRCGVPMPAVPRPLAFLIVIAALKVLLIGYWIVGGADLIGQQSSLEAPTLATAEADPAAEEPLAAAGANAPPAADELQTLSEPNLDEPPSTPRDDDLLTLDETLPIEPAGWRALLAPGAAAAGGTGLQPLVDDSPPVQEIAESIEPGRAPAGLARRGAVDGPPRRDHQRDRGAFRRPQPRTAAVQRHRRRRGDQRGNRDLDPQSLTPSAPGATRQRWTRRPWTRGRWTRSRWIRRPASPRRSTDPRPRLAFVEVGLGVGAVAEGLVL